MAAPNVVTREAIAAVQALTLLMLVAGYRQGAYPDACRVLAVAVLNEQPVCGLRCMACHCSNVGGVADAMVAVAPSLAMRNH